MNFWTDVMIPLDLFTRLPMFVPEPPPVPPEPVEFVVILDVDAILQAFYQNFQEVFEGIFLWF